MRKDIALSKRITTETKMMKGIDDDQGPEVALRQLMKRNFGVLGYIIINKTGKVQEAWLQKFRSRVPIPSLYYMHGGLDGQLQGPMHMCTTHSMIEYMYEPDLV